MIDRDDIAVPEAPSGPFERNHAFWYIATPKIFEWFEWVAILGAIKYLFNKTHSIIILALFILGLAGLLFYFNGFLEHHFRSLPFMRSSATRRLLSGFASSVLAALAFFLAQYAVAAFSATAP